MFPAKTSFANSSGPVISIQKLVVIGNIAGGKTRLSRRLAELYGLPLTHVDTLQFLPGLQMRPLPETRKMLNEIALQPQWLIDGYGPLDLIEKRFQMADRIVLIDLPLWRHLWWLTKRQLKSLIWQRPELPEGCSEANLEHTLKLYQQLWGMHYRMRPELLRILGREPLKSKVQIIRSLKDWKRTFREGL